MPQSGKLLVLNLLIGQKSDFSPHRGDSLHGFTSNLAGPTGMWIHLAVQNFTSIVTGGWECGPKYQKFPLFGKESPRGDSLDRFRKNLRRFYTPSYPTLVFQISSDSHHRLRSYCWETTRLSIRPNFSVHSVGKTMRWIKKWIAPLSMVSTSSITMQSLGKIAQCPPAVGAKMWCLFFCFCFLSRSESVAPCIRGVHSSNKHCVAVYCPISMRFSAFFHKGLLFQKHYLVRIFVARWRHNCEKSKNLQKSLFAPLHIESWRI